MEPEEQRLLDLEEKIEEFRKHASFLQERTGELYMELERRVRKLELGDKHVGKHLK